MQVYEPLVRKTQAAQGKAREDAFGELIAQFQSVAHNWAYNVLGDAQQAQDVTQDAFLTAYQRIDQLRDPAAFPAWLKRIVLTYCSRVTRRKSPYLLPLDDDNAPSLADDAPPQADPAVHAEDRDLKEQVSRAVRALPQHEREVTELFYITGYSQQEIAEALAVPLTTVKKRLQYAREHLRETMPPMSMLYPQSAGMLSAGGLVGQDDMFAPPDLFEPDNLLRLLALVYPEMLVIA